MLPPPWSTSKVWSCIRVSKQHWHVPLHMRALLKRAAGQESLSRLFSRHVDARHALQHCVWDLSGCDAAAGDVVLRNNTVHHAYYQKEKGAAICAFATGLDDHPSGTSLQPQCSA